MERDQSDQLIEKLQSIADSLDTIAGALSLIFGVMDSAKKPRYMEGIRIEGDRAVQGIITEDGHLVLYPSDQE